MPRSPTSVLSRLDQYLSDCAKTYSECIDHVGHAEGITGVTATSRLHHLRFDANGKPMVEALAAFLYEYIIDYAISSRHRSKALSTKEAARITKEARRLFILPETSTSSPDQTGEAGELLLYFLIEAILKAPQVVSKVELKTNRKKEIHGSDGIHMVWNKTDSVVDLFLGEAKIHKSLYNALDGMFESLTDFHQERQLAHELLVVTRHFKHADQAIKDEVEKLLRQGVPTSRVRINHACLIGYNWDQYQKLKSKRPASIVQEFRTAYETDAPRLHKLLQSRFDSFKHKHLRFEIFLLPFESVQDFRDKFNQAMR
jgi:hypothetical protein